MASGYFYLYTNCIPIMMFPTLSLSILMLFTDSKGFDLINFTTLMRYLLKNSQYFTPDWYTHL